MELRRTVENGVVVLSPNAALFDDAVDGFGSAVTQCVQAGEQKLLIDLGDVAFMDSRALEILMAAQDQLRSMGGDLKICRPSLTCRDILKVTRLARRFDVHADRATVLRSFQ